MNLLDITHCYARKGGFEAIDFPIQHNGQTVGMYSGKTLDELRAAYKDESIDVVLLSELAERSESSHLDTDPIEVTWAQYNEALEILPPIYATRGSFQMSEFTSGRITTAYVHVGNRFWSFPVVAGTPHDQLVKRVTDYLARSAQ